MRRLWDLLLPKIWARLFVMTITAIVLTWGVVGIAYFWLSTARNVVDALSAEQMPKLIQTTELAAKSSELAMLSNRILYSTDKEPEKLEVALRHEIAALDRLLTASFDDAGISGVPDILQRELAGVIHSLNRARQLEEELRRKVERLRWISVDLEDETAPFVADYAYNIQSLTRTLTREPDSEKRQNLAGLLRKDRGLHTVFVGLGNDTAIATTLAIQASAGLDEQQLSQFAGLLSDSLSNINTKIGELPQKDEYLTLRQSVEALNRLSLGPGSIVSNRSEWVKTRKQLAERLEGSLTRLSELQQDISNVTETRRQDIQATSRGFADRSRSIMRFLVLTTLIAALAGLAILFLYIRPAIIRPVERLTRAMRDIAAGREPELPALPPRNDEIAKLTRAVESFQNAVTQREQAIEKLRQTQSELVQAGKMAALGNLSAGISHELNQPLGAIRQRLHVTERALVQNDTEAVQLQTGKIGELVTRMEKIITHLRRFARQSEYRKEKVPLTAVIEAAQELLKSRMEAAGIRFETDPALEGTCLLGDAVLCEQVLINLISNAIDAIIETGGPGRIDIRLELAAKGYIAFSVLDSGAGLGDLDPGRAIDPFVSTKPPGAGLGLGLSISYNIITGMGGKLYLVRRKNAGTRATVHLPDGKGWNG